MGQTRSVGRLEQPWAKRTMHLNRRPDDLAGKALLMQHRSRLLSSELAFLRALRVSVVY